jgi:hypothetical protein
MENVSLSLIVSAGSESSIKKIAENSRFVEPSTAKIQENNGQCHPGNCEKNPPQNVIINSATLNTEFDTEHLIEKAGKCTTRACE